MSKSAKLAAIQGLPLLLALAGCHSGSGRMEMIDTNGSLQPLRGRFNAERDRVRVVALLSPL